MVIDGGGRGAVTLTTPQESCSTPFPIKYPHLEKMKNDIYIFKEKNMSY